jgi:hypothetical protein
VASGHPQEGPSGKRIRLWRYPDRFVARAHCRPLHQDVSFNNVKLYILFCLPGIQLRVLIIEYYLFIYTHRYHEQDLRVRLGEWDVNHDVEFYPYVETDVVNMVIHREFYAGTLYNDLAILRMDKPVDFARNPHVSPACLPDAFSDFTGQRCWTTGWGKDAFGDYGKYQNILKVSFAYCIKYQNSNLSISINANFFFLYNISLGKNLCF